QMLPTVPKDLDRAFKLRTSLDRWSSPKASSELQPYHSPSLASSRVCIDTVNYHRTCGNPLSASLGVGRCPAAGARRAPPIGSPGSENSGMKGMLVTRSEAMQQR